MKTKKLTQKQAIALLKKHIKDKKVFEKVLKHSKLVQRIALKHANKIKGADLNFIKTASLLHDIGRGRYPPKTRFSYKHGIEGARILVKEGFPKHARVCECHFGVGITKKEIIKRKLKLPKKDFFPITIEEKIITYSDKWAKHDKLIPITEIKARFMQELGKKYAKKFEKLHTEIERLKKVK